MERHPRCVSPCATLPAAFTLPSPESLGGPTPQPLRIATRGWALIRPSTATVILLAALTVRPWGDLTWRVARGHSQFWPCCRFLLSDREASPTLKPRR